MNGIRYVKNNVTRLNLPGPDDDEKLIVPPDVEQLVIF